MWMLRINHFLGNVPVFNTLRPNFLSHLKQTQVCLTEVQTQEGGYYGCYEIRTNYVRQLEII